MDLRRTPLYDVHVAEGGRIVAFAGFEMPVQYEGILAECKAVRTAAGVFDVSHMGRFRVRGEGALASVQRAVSCDASTLEAGRCQYGLLLTEEAGIADDLFVYSPEGRSDHLTLVVNASNAAKDYAMIERCLEGADLLDETPETAMLAVQGPAANEIVAGMTGLDLGAVGLHQFASGRVAGLEATLSRTGYTGEDGFEIVTSAADGPVLWRALRDAGVAPCGLGARDVLRLEAAYPLWGHEIDEDTRPADVGLSRYCAAEKPDYVGKAAHEAYLAAGPTKTLVGLKTRSKRIARDGAEVRLSGRIVGRVTSGTFSPVNGCGIALAHLDNPKRTRRPERLAELAGVEVICRSGSTDIEAVLVAPPFYRRAK